MPTLCATSNAKNQKELKQLIPHLYAFEDKKPFKRKETPFNYGCIPEELGN